jgi:hypothetical protein
VDALAILHRCLGAALAHIHARCLQTLFEAVVGRVSGPRLALTGIGRRFAGDERLRHPIKRADRLLGNRHLQQEARSVYAALCRVKLARIARSWTSGEYLVEVFIAPSSQEMEPPRKAGQFRALAEIASGGKVHHTCTSFP